MICGTCFSDEAIYHYHQALQVKPDDPGIHFNYGMALVKKSNLEEAIRHFEMAINLKPDYNAAHLALRLALDIQQRQKR